MAVLSKVTSRPGDLKWAAYSKWKGANDDKCELCFVLEDIGHFGYGDGGWFCLPKWVGLQVEQKQWFAMGADPEQVIEIPLNSRDWAKVRSDEQWQAALEQVTPPDSLREHFRELFQIIQKKRNWLIVTAAQQDSMPGAPSQDHENHL
ncbi:hypothetical protein COCOBI_15-3260 [Coccomyxa sp. Obi]|nr:hypothetical protein COCOBI_15-3260 [Coccomyxa sp. Obi]